MGLDEEQARECVRVSFGKHNTLEEMDKAAALFVETVGKLRKK
jgi:cysteine sulfinate desulfinase/cysteine desulfurase-like protein